MDPRKGLDKSLDIHRYILVHKNLGKVSNVASLPLPIIHYNQYTPSYTYYSIQLECVRANLGTIQK
jgi:hypothetical protein